MGLQTITNHTMVQRRKDSGAEQDRKGSPWRIPVDALKPEKEKEFKNGRKNYN
jgi:hypothetical protein